MRTIKEKEADDPEAYNFDTVGAANGAKPLPEESPLSEVFKGKAALLGIDIHLRGNIYARPPKLKQERMLVKGQNHLYQGETQSALEILEEAALSILFVRGDDDFRQATSEDIEEVFDSGDLMAILSGAMGAKFTETESGNA